MGAESTRPRAWRRPPGQRPILLGHRGASAYATENTPAAFRRAMADGADGVELDVQRCGSGEVVVFHDDDLARLSNRAERIEDLPLAALREARLRGGGEIPTLAEAFEACGPRALVNVEIKHQGLTPAGCADLVAGVADAVTRAGAEARVLVSSFSPAAVWLWQRRCPGVPCGLLFERQRRFRRPWPLQTHWLLSLLHPAAAHPEHVLCTEASVRHWHHRGYAVNVWTVDDPKRILELAEMGVDAIISNNPGAAGAALSLTT